MTEVAEDPYEPHSSGGKASGQRVADRRADDPSEMTDAWIELVYPSLYRTAWMMTGDRVAAEDLVQESLIEAMRHWSRFRGESSRSTWIHGILIRLIRKHFRSLSRLRRRIHSYVQQSSTQRVQTDEDHFAKAEWSESVWAAVARLPRHHAEALTLRFGHDLTYERIAETVGCAVGTAKSRVHFGLKRLRNSNQLRLEINE